eukprot:23332_1
MTEPQSYFGITGIILSSKGSLILVLVFAHQLFKTKHTITKPDVYVSLLTYICYLLFCFSILILSIMEVQGTFTDFGCIMLFTYASWLVPGKILMYIFFTIRLHQIFKGSIFSYPKFKLLLFSSITCTLIAIFSIIILLVTIPDIIKVNSKHITINSVQECINIISAYQKQNSIMIQLVGITGFVLTDICASIVLLRLYLKKLLILSITFDRITQKTELFSHNFSNSQKEKMEDDSYYLQLAIKTTNLLILSTSTSWAAIFLQMLQNPVWLVLDVICNVVT